MVRLAPFLIKGFLCLSLCQILSVSPALALAADVDKADFRVIPRLVHTSEIHQIAASPDGRYLATFADDGAAFVWDLASDTVVSRLSEGKRLHYEFIKFSRDSRQVALSTSGYEVQQGTTDSQLIIGDIASGSGATKQEAHIKGEKISEVSEDLHFFATKSGVFNVENGANVYEFNSAAELKQIATNRIDTVRFLGTDRVIIHLREEYENKQSGNNGVYILNYNTHKIESVIELKKQSSSILGPVSESGGFFVLVLDGRIELRHLRDPSTSINIKAKLGGVSSIAVSPDGSLLALALNNGASCEIGQENCQKFVGFISVFDTKTGQQISQINEPKDGGYINSITFSADSSTLFITDISSYKFVSAWDARTGAHLRDIGAARADEVASVSSSAGGLLLAVGHAEDAIGGKQGTVGVWDLRKLALLRSEKFEGSNPTGFISADERTLLLIGSGNRTNVIDLHTGEAVGTLNSARAPFAAPAGGKKMYFVEPQRVLIWDAENRLFPPLVHQIQAMKKIEMGKHLPNDIAISPDGSLMAGTSGNDDSEGLDYDFALYVWNTKDFRLMKRIALDGGANGAAFSPDGKTLAFSTHKIHLFSVGGLKEMKSLTGSAEGLMFAPDGKSLYGRTREQGVVTWNLETGARTEWGGHIGWTTALAGSSDGSRLASGGHDGRVNIWDARSGAIIATLVTSRDEWVIVLPEGFFASSPSGAKLMQVQKGNQVLSIEDFYQTLYRPDLVRQKLAGDPDGLVRKAAERLDLGKVLASGSPPDVRIERQELVADGSKVRVQAKLVDRGGGFGRVEFRRNGVTAALVESADVPASGEVQATLSLGAGDNLIETTAFNAQNLITSKVASAHAEGKVSEADKPPSLYVLAIGVADYKDKRLHLKYPAKDAEAIAQALTKGGANLFANVETIELLNRQVTVKTVEEAFARLAEKMTPQDVFVLYLAGHGMTVDGRYHFMPSDIAYAGEESVVRDAIGQDRMQGLLARLPAMRSVLIYDTCESGSASQENGSFHFHTANAAFDRLTQSVGRTILAATLDDAPAADDYNGNGLFTSVILAGLSGKEAQKDGEIHVHGLARYLLEQAPKISSKFGTPQTPVARLIGADFPIARAQ